MCDPGTLLAGASLAIGIGSDIAGASAQNKAAAANKAAALAALTEDWKTLSMRQTQEQDAEQQTIMQIDRQAREADALASVSAGESGVAGASVDALHGNIDQKAADAKVTAGRNLDMTLAQIQREKAAAAANAQSRIDAVQGANPFATALQIGSQAIDFGSTLIRRKPSPSTSPSD